MYFGCFLLGFQCQDLNLLLSLPYFIFVPKVRRHVSILALLGAEPWHTTLVRDTVDIIDSFLTDSASILCMLSIFEMVCSRYTFNGNDVALCHLPVFLIARLLIW